MRILLVAEGEHELSGALEAFVRRLLGAGPELTMEPLYVSDPCVRVNTRPGKGGALKKRILRWALEAEKRGCDALVLLVDEDGDRDRRQQVRDANETTGVGAPFAAGVAIRTFDAWMLADEQAMSSALGQMIECQKSPERIGNPKAVFLDHHRRTGAVVPPREAYRLIAEAADLELLEARCEDGFGPFAGAVRRLRKS
ncbi:MAG TPA: DUF4276 family protein [Phycisphaerae bacterium]|nr:DUF4276 family protein [Phycisphaerae bacterium]